MLQLWLTHQSKAICTLTNSGYTALKYLFGTISTYFSVYIKKESLHN
jgi:hypothetical protein